MGKKLKIAAVLALLAAAVFALAGRRHGLPRLPDGTPDLNGFWQATGTPNHDLESAGVVEDGPIPYKLLALQKRETLRAHRLEWDPVRHCDPAGIPRAEFVSPFRIEQNGGQLVFSYAGAKRTVLLGEAVTPPGDSWMGHSRGHWQGDTLVVDVRGMNELSWLDESGNFHSVGLHVEERFSLEAGDRIRYEAMLDDPIVYSRPWKLHLLLTRSAPEKLTADCPKR